MRTEAVAALDVGQAAPVRQAVTCLREATISEAQAGLIESRDGAVLILDKAEGGSVIGMLTLHDLLRAQDALAQQGEAT